MLCSPDSLKRRNTLSSGPMRSGEREGFTLLELLIVVAIIAILAAIAVPNFMEAQTRSKVARVRADFHAIATAIEAYAVDHIDYPRNWNPENKLLNNHLSPDLTTPVAYLTTHNIHDPFTRYVRGYGNFDIYTYCRIVPVRKAENMEFPWRPEPVAVHNDIIGVDWCWSNPQAFQKYGHWFLRSIGPDGVPTSDLVSMKPSHIISHWSVQDIPYDSTNGTKSFGNILRTQLHPEGKIQYRSPK